MREVCNHGTGQDIWNEIYLYTPEIRRNGTSTNHDGRSLADTVRYMTQNIANREKE